MNELKSVFCVVWCCMQCALRGLECDAQLIHLHYHFKWFRWIPKLRNLVDEEGENLGIGDFQVLKVDSCKQFSESEENSFILVFWGNKRSNLVAVESISRFWLVLVFAQHPPAPMLQDHPGLKCTWNYTELIWVTCILYLNKSGMLQHRQIIDTLIWNSVAAGDYFSCRV